MTGKYVLFPLVVGSVSALFLVPFVIRLGHRLGMLDNPGKHKRHKRPVPYLGGVALFLSFWTAIGSTLLFKPSLLDDIMAPLPYIVAAAVIIFLVGLSDDIKPISAWIKLLAQIAAGIILCMGDMRIDPLTIPFVGSVEVGNLSYLITIIWVVLLSNAINLIDGLDGLAGGVSLIAASSLAVVGIVLADWSVAVLAASLSGFLSVFLFSNKYPARIFLGDSGSLQIGFYFAVISLAVPIRTFTATALYLPLLVLGVPLLETTISISRRLAGGRNIMKADRRHLFHYLALAGMSPRRILFLFYMISLVFGGISVALLYFNRFWVLSILLLFMVVIFVGFYFFMANMNIPGRRQTGRKLTD